MSNYRTQYQDLRSIEQQMLKTANRWMLYSAGKFDIHAHGTRRMLPVDPRFAHPLGITAHSGGLLGEYQGGADATGSTGEDLGCQGGIDLPSSAGGKLFPALGGHTHTEGIHGMESTAHNKPKKGEFFLLEAGKINGPASGVVFENLDRLLSPPRLILKPEGGGFPTFRETPRLVHTPQQGPAAVGLGTRV